MRGRKAIPNEIKIAKGNPGGRPIRAAVTVKKIKSFMDAPDHVKAQVYAEETWNNTLPSLLEMGIMGESDIIIFAQFCIAVGMNREAVVALSEVGMTYESINEFGGKMIRKSPYIEIANQAMRLSQSLGSEFGLTPSGRAKLSIKPKGVNPLDEFLNDNSKAH